MNNFGGGRSGDPSAWLYSLISLRIGVSQRHGERGGRAGHPGKRRSDITRFHLLPPAAYPLVKIEAKSFASHTTVSCLSQASHK